MARLAGVPDSVINRAKELVEQLSDADITAAVKNLTGPETRHKKKISADQVDMGQISLFETVKNEDIINEIQDMELSAMTPLEALNYLYTLQNKIRNRWTGN